MLHISAPCHRYMVTEVVPHATHTYISRSVMAVRTDLFTEMDAHTDRPLLSWDQGSFDLHLHLLQCDGG